jgi:DnaK suppressor protein
MPETDPTYADLLQERVAQAEAQQDALTTAIENMRVARSLTFADDEHDPEGSTVSLDQARDVALLDQVEQTLTELVAARQRLASGTYGRCDRCGREIPPDRLLARPEGSFCVACSRSTASRRR